MEGMLEMDFRSMSRRPLATSSQYAVALASVAVATWLRMLLDPILENHLPFVTFFVAVMVASWFGGIGSSVVALLIGWAAATYFFVPSRYSFMVVSAVDAVGLFLYFFVGIFSLVLIQARHAAQQRAEASEEKLRRLNADLELRVQERTADLQKAKETLEAEARLKAFAVDVGAALTEPALLKDSLHKCAEAMVRYLGAAFARIWLLNHEQNVLELRASAGMYTNLEGAHARIPVGQYKIGLIAQERQPHLTNQVIDDPRVHDQEWAKREGMVAFAGYPLLVEGRVLGVMAMFARQKLSEDVLEAMRTVAHGIAQFIERGQKEELLRAANDSLRAVIQSSPIGIVVLDPHGTVKMWNPASERMFGWSQQEVLGHPLPIVPPDKQEETSELRARVLRNEAFSNLELIRQKKDGSPIEISLSTAPLHDAGGNISGILGLMVDITERKRVERQAQRMERLAALGQLLGGIAHELKNPLFILSGHVQLLQNKLVHQEFAALPAEMQKIEAAAVRMPRITERFLALAKPYQPRRERCTVDAILRQTLDFLANELMKNQVTVNTTIAADLPAILSDPMQLQEVFLNLMLNALQAMAAAHGRGTLTVATKLVANSQQRAASEEKLSAISYQLPASEEKWIEVRIQDDGPGIAPEHQSKLFEPFFTTKPLEQGTGLGLWIVRNTVTALKGAVACETEVGRGTTFIVRLPVTEELVHWSIDDCQARRMSSYQRARTGYCVMSGSGVSRTQSCSMA
jgi:PAS domain S-box-containing protein